MLKKKHDVFLETFLLELAKDLNLIFQQNVDNVFQDLQFVLLALACEAFVLKHKQQHR